MTELKCSVTSCAYHEEHRCCLNNIKVEGTTADVSDSTACASFVDRKKMGYRNAFIQEPRQALVIECMAEKCAYNRGLNCTADHVHVAGNQAKEFDETKCDTFVL